MKSKLLSLILVCLLISSVFAGCKTKEPELNRYEASYLTLFDTVTTIVGYAPTKEAFQETAEQIQADMLRYHQYYDIYNEYEGIVNLKTVNDNAAIEPVAVSQEIIDLLLFSKEYYEKTNGKVNIALGSVLSVWHEYREEGIENPEDAELPPMELLQEASNHINFDDLVIDTTENTVFFKDPDMKLDVGAIGKGYAVQRVCEKLPSGLLISVGGNLYATGPKDASGTPWVVGVKNPLDPSGSYLHTLYLSNGAVVTSGDYQRYYVVDEKEYHHIIDPVTLMPADYFRAVTIITPHSGVADALSTALYTMSLEDGQALIESLDNTEALWVLPDESMVYSSGFKNSIKS